MTKIVAFGGGHGLAASLRALRALQRKKREDLDITAVVTVGDDGGSSGRLRADRGIVPPGDIRQALAALADENDPAAGQTVALLQHRFAGSDPLTGHPVGNLMLCGLMELLGDPVQAIDHVAAMVGATGRVLPMSCDPVWIEADVSGADGVETTVRGQHNVAVAKGVVRTLRLNPSRPAPCAEAVAATKAADWLIFGPGSWYTSVIPHLLVPELADAIAHSAARRLITLNLAVEQETSGLSLPDHLAALTRYLPGLRVDVVLADGNAIGAPEPVRRAAESLGAELVLAPVAVRGATTRHDPVALAAALEPILSAERWSPPSA
ncbi:uridine diphosphate-N-acetylglucosamine-binding protein YvcK [Virgisporangium ochraceum]|uniref:Putative gluconeogenesis factor n=1 Tax=Virgisporangium ochraceum TaxID=65505 RepID=A0A8J4A4U1_9ACTN|nr:uridine diphosphate-N-acetylglucosamine-binding protein YvcK [Virgisporangium ochraceum]GIJ74928.1 putative gluconeogenesis factor [Virgisporangium ochraceum]